MRPADLTTPELVDLLDCIYRAHLDATDDSPGQDERAALADYLGCHPEVRDAVWEAWSAELTDAGQMLGDAEYWLDVEFIEPCHEERSQV
ncbi:hypothetical protein [Deinococcus hohokamensis]|uniref:Uncharacterized protein n=1 Tax=Deinococcus hohokamensis TaxID=309883 RepID=A0ABV9I888_9DEIO